MGQSKAGRPVFTRQEIEQHLQSALSAATPDVWSRLDLTVPQKLAGDADLTKIQRLEDWSRRTEEPKDGVRRRERPAEPGPRPGQGWARLRSRAASLGRASMSWGAAAAACICLLAAGGGYYHYDRLQVVSSVEIDVNPSLRLSLNRREKVLQVQALNEDGAGLLDTGSLKGQPVGAAVDQVVDALVDKGYLGQDGEEHAILVSVSGKDPEKAEQLKAEVSANVESVLLEKEVRAVVYDQTIQVTEGLEELAQTYQVSMGKAGFVDQLIIENEELDGDSQETYSQLMGQTMEELTQEIGQKSYQVSAKVTVVRTGPKEEPVRMADAWEGEDGDRSGEEGQSRSDPEQGAQEETRKEAPDAAVPVSGQPEGADASKGALAREEGQPEGAGDSDAVLAGGQGAFGKEEETAVPLKEGQPDGAEAPKVLGAVPSGAAGAPAQIQDEGEKEEAEGQQPAENESRPEEGEPEPAEPESHPAGEESQPAEPETHPAGIEPEPTEPEARPEEGEPEPTEAEARPAGEESQPTEPEARPEEGEPEPTEPEARPEEGEPEPAEAEAHPAGEESQPTEPEARPEEGEPEPAEPEARPAGIESQPTEPESRPAGEESQPAAAGAHPADAGVQPTEEEGSPKVHRHVRAEAPDPTEEMEEQMEEEGLEEVGRIIRNTSDEWSVFAPGDMKTRQEMGQTAASDEYQLLFEEQEKKKWQEPVYASEFMSSAERRLLGKGPGAFSQNASEEEKKEILWFGPGFAFLNESTRNFFTQLLEGKD